MSLQLSPLQAMQLALAEARKGWGRTRPNPNVGCVILSQDGSIVSAGYHEKVGEAHAEINAIKNTSPERLNGATVVVTLEPCAHEGRTGSCAKALAALPIREVVYGLVDPNPQVSGKGLEILTAAGKKVTSLRETLAHGEEDSYALVKSKLEEVAEHFLWNQRHSLPFIAIKVGTTADGAMSYASGEPKWMTGSESREEVHRLRAGFAAMLVGKNTFLRDDPHLNIRHPQYDGMRNKAIVLDSGGEALHKLRGSKLYAVHDPSEIYWVLSKENAMSQAPASVMAKTLGINVIEGPIEEALPKLYAAGIDSIMVEGGSQVLDHFIEKKLAQRLYHFVSPVIAGDKAGVKFNWDSKNNLIEPFTTKFGEDTLVTGRIK